MSWGLATVLWSLNSKHRFGVCGRSWNQIFKTFCKRQTKNIERKAHGGRRASCKGAYNYKHAK